LIEINFANHSVTGTVDSCPVQTEFPFIKECLAPFQVFLSSQTPQASPGASGDGNNVFDMTGFDRWQTASTAQFDLHQQSSCEKSITESAIAQQYAYRA